MTPAAITKAAPSGVSLAAAKQLATLRAHAALTGAELIAIEGDDDGAELLLTHGAATRRFRDLTSARAAVYCAEALD